MKWYEGSIPSAIQLARGNRSVFIVYISGQDDLSKNMDETWENKQVCEACEKTLCVALKLKANSEECAQFSQIYPVVCVPCTYFIGGNGIPLEVSAGAVTPEDFVKTIQNAHQSNSAPDMPSQQSNVSTETPPDVAAPEESSVSMPTDTQPQSLQSFSDTESNEPTPSSEPPSMSKEERVERAKELIAQKREEKAQQSKEKSKAEELERRKLGQDMSKFKQWKTEQEAREVKDQMRKEKLEEKQARERVRQQIARDRAERAAKYQKEKQEQAVAKQQAQEAKSAADAEAQAQRESVRRETARLQFRFPDGTSLTHQFPSSDLLSTARQFVEENDGRRFGNFQMSTIYPKRTFTQSDESMSMLDLNLAPSAVVIVLPGGHKSTVSKPSGSGGDGFLWVLLAPLVALWGFICNFLFGRPQQHQSSQQSSQQSQNINQEPPQTSTRVTRPKTAQGLRNRQEGNIRRFTADDDDDDSATWNGNSTQQM